MIISNTSPLIALDNIGYLNILKKLYEKIYIPGAVAEEFKKDLPAWIKILKADKETSELFIRTLGKGEAQVIALGVKNRNCILLIDEKKARNIAKSLGIKIKGTLTLIIEAKKKGIITSVKDILFLLKQNNFRISNELTDQILLIAGE